MKKVIFSILSVVVLAGGISSCGKSTKGKVSNDWKIESLEATTTDVSSGGDVNTTKTTVSGANIAVVTTDTPSGQSSTTTTQNGTWNEGKFSIKKDGTYERILDFTFINTTANVTTSSKNTVTETGTWSFVGKSKDEDFKKNERILFNTLAINNTVVATTTIANTSTTQNTVSNETYLTGEQVVIYTITESKSKSLELTSEAKHTYNAGSNNSSNTTSASIKLTQE